MPNNLTNQESMFYKPILAVISVFVLINMFLFSPLFFGILGMFAGVAFFFKFELSENETEHHKDKAELSFMYDYTLAKRILPLALGVFLLLTSLGMISVAAIMIILGLVAFSTIATWFGDFDDKKWWEPLVGAAMIVIGALALSGIMPIAALITTLPLAYTPLFLSILVTLAIGVYGISQGKTSSPSILAAGCMGLIMIAITAFPSGIILSFLSTSPVLFFGLAVSMLGVAWFAKEILTPEIRYLTIPAALIFLALGIALLIPAAASFFSAMPLLPPIIMGIGFLLALFFIYHYASNIHKEKVAEQNLSLGAKDPRNDSKGVLTQTPSGRSLSVDSQGDSLASVFSLEEEPERKSQRKCITTGNERMSDQKQHVQYPKTTEIKKNLEEKCEEDVNTAYNAALSALKKIGNTQIESKNDIELISKLISKAENHIALDKWPKFLEKLEASKTYLNKLITIRSSSAHTEIIKNLVEESRTQKTSIRYKDKALTYLNTENKKLNEELTAAKEKLEAEQKAKTELTVANEALKTAQAAAERDKAADQKAIAELKTAQQQAAAAGRRAEEKLETAESRAEAAKTELKAKMQQLEAAQAATKAEATAAKKAQAEAEGAIRKLKVKLTNVTGQNKRQAGIINEKSSENSRLQERLQSLANDNTAYKKLNTKQITTNAALKQQLQKAQAEFKGELEVGKKEMQMLKDTLKAVFATYRAQDRALRINISEKISHFLNQQKNITATDLEKLKEDVTILVKYDLITNGINLLENLAKQNEAGRSDSKDVLIDQQIRRQWYKLKDKILKNFPQQIRLFRITQNSKIHSIIGEIDKILGGEENFHETSRNLSSGADSYAKSSADGPRFPAPNAPVSSENLPQPGTGSRAKDEKTVARIEIPENKSQCQAPGSPTDVNPNKPSTT